MAAEKLIGSRKASRYPTRPVPLSTLDDTRVTGDPHKVL